MPEPHLGAITWAARQLSSPVVDVRRLLGGQTSTMLALTDAGGTVAVLRLITEEPWRTHGAGLAARESQVQDQLADLPVRAPRTIALDAEGVYCAHPGHLMTWLPGAVDPGRTAPADLIALAELLATVHEVRVEPMPRAFQSWAWEAKYVVPAWCGRPEAWERAFTLLRQPPPLYEATFLHRDFALRNVLWDGPSISGVVDWVETSTGPAWLDVAHCTTNLALDHGEDVAESFATAYVAATGRHAEPWWDLVDVVGFLPPPGGAWFTTNAGRLARLETRLTAVLNDL